MKGRYNWIISGPSSVRDNVEIVTVVQIQFEILGNPLYFRKDEKEYSNLPFVCETWYLFWEDAVDGKCWETQCAAT